MIIVYNISMQIVKENFTIPNCLTISRIVLIPFFGYFIFEGEVKKASLLFVAMAISDFLDGFIARKFNQISRLGKFLDPLADKMVILTSIFVAGFFSVNYSIPFYFATIIFIKELYILVGIVVIYMFRGRFNMKTLFIGKITMFFEYLTVVLFFIAFYWSSVHSILIVFYFITGLLAILSMVLYTIRN
ncbi:MAG: CDP-alcohol phosphatidyltransferase family protein [Calditerrivibrio sp.]|nr:CDP-alcohol phosphatidyltransferase family protein [Calditerrivibrio sp.]